MLEIVELVACDSINIIIHGRINNSIVVVAVVVAVVAAIGCNYTFSIYSI